VIKTFKCAETYKIWKGEVSKKIAQNIQNTVRRKLRMMNNAYNINDLRIPPANHLEKLKGNRKNQYSIKVNDQFRICFEFQDGNCFNIETVDYH
jgi:proteic killer suppression protein